MIVDIVLEDPQKTYTNMYENIGAKLHESLKGNKDYINSSIVLNVDEKAENGAPVCTLYFRGNECSDKEYIREKAKVAIDLFIDNL